MIDVADAPTDGRLYRELAPELVRFATALVGRSDAQDVMANAFAKAMASRSWPSATGSAVLATDPHPRTFVPTVLRGLLAISTPNPP